MSQILWLPLGKRTNPQPKTQDAHAMCYKDVLTEVSDGWGRNTEERVPSSSSQKGGHRT